MADIEQGHYSGLNSHRFWWCRGGGRPNSPVSSRESPRIRDVSVRSGQADAGVVVHGDQTRQSQRRAGAWRWGCCQLWRFLTPP